MNHKHQPIIFGEVLFYNFPSGEQVLGAAQQFASAVVGLRGAVLYQRIPNFIGFLITKKCPKLNLSCH